MPRKGYPNTTTEINMSKLFSDPEFERLHSDDDAWLELAMDPFRYDLVDVMHSMPDEISVGFEDVLFHLKGRKSDSYLNLSAQNIINSHLADARNYGKKTLKTEELDAITGMYEFIIEPGTIVDFKRRFMSNPIILKKTKVMTERELVELAVDQAMYHLQSGISNPKVGTPDHKEMLSRLNEVIDIVDSSLKSRSCRSINKKRCGLAKRLRSIFVEFEWQVKSADIMVDFCKNIRMYVESGNMHAMMNLTRLKCMTHKGNPIYSMEKIS